MNAHKFEGGQQICCRRQGCADTWQLPMHKKLRIFFKTLSNLYSWLQFMLRPKIHLWSKWNQEMAHQHSLWGKNGISGGQWSLSQKLFHCKVNVTSSCEFVRESSQIFNAESKEHKLEWLDALLDIKSKTIFNLHLISSNQALSFGFEFSIFLRFFS